VGNLCPIIKWSRPKMGKTPGETRSIRRIFFKRKPRNSILRKNHPWIAGNLKRIFWDQKAGTLPISGFWSPAIQAFHVGKALCPINGPLAICKGMRPPAYRSHRRRHRPLSGDPQRLRTEDAQAFCTIWKNLMKMPKAYKSSFRDSGIFQMAKPDAQ